MDFNLFKPKARGWECLGPSVLAKAATFENSCDLSMWMATRYKANKTDDSFSKWQLEHTSVLNKLNLRLQAEYPNEKNLHGMSNSEDSSSWKCFVRHA